MAYKKFSIYGGVKISERAISAAIIIGLIALAAVMVIGNRIGFTASFESAGRVVEVQHLHYGERVERPSDPTGQATILRDGIRMKWVRSSTIFQEPISAVTLPFTLHGKERARL